MIMLYDSKGSYHSNSLGDTFSILTFGQRKMAGRQRDLSLQCSLAKSDQDQTSENYFIPLIIVKNIGRISNGINKIHWLPSAGHIYLFIHLTSFTNF